MNSSGADAIANKPQIRAVITILVCFAMVGISDSFVGLRTLRNALCHLYTPKVLLSNVTSMVIPGVAYTIPFSMTPPPRINYSTTRQEALALGLEVAGNTDFARKFHRHGWWIFALIWFGVLLAKNWPLEHEHFMVNGQSAPGVVGIITLIIIGGTSILFGWITAKGLKHMASRYLEAKIRRLPDSNFTSERSIEASKDQLIIRFPDIERHYPWHAVKKLEAGSNYLSVVGANQRALVVIPTRSFPSPEAQSEFENFCRQKISGLAEQM